MKTPFAIIGIAMLAAAPAGAQSTTSSYSCRTVSHIHAPDTRDCTYTSSNGYSSTQSCGYVERVGTPHEYVCSDITTIDLAISQGAVSILRGH